MQNAYKIKLRFKIFEKEIEFPHKNYHFYYFCSDFISFR